VFDNYAQDTSFRQTDMGVMLQCMAAVQLEVDALPVMNGMRHVTHTELVLRSAFTKGRSNVPAASNDLV
jgi:hypothetical protein